MLRRVLHRGVSQLSGTALLSLQIYLAYTYARWPVFSEVLNKNPSMEVTLANNSLVRVALEMRAHFEYQTSATINTNKDGIGVAMTERRRYRHGIERCPVSFY